MSRPLLVDTHVHLNHADLRKDLAGIVSRAADSGVGRFVIVGYDIESSRAAVEISETDSRFVAAVGVHPHSAAVWSDPSTESCLRELLAHDKTAALGEIGLDFYRDLSPRDMQNQAFSAQLALARESGKPVIIHCRDAYPECIAQLEDEADGIKILLHCWQGTPAQADRCAANGWHFGIGGSVTFKNSDDLRAAVRRLPAERLVLETDAPYLSPVPFRGVYPNEPNRVALVAEKIAELRGESLETVASFTTNNAIKLFWPTEWELRAT